MRACLTAVLLLLAACAVHPEGEQPSDNPLAVRDAYLIAHGMAIGVIVDGPPPAPVIEELERLDLGAALALHALWQDPSDAQLAQANAAVGALAGFVARQPDVPPPPGAARPAALPPAGTRPAAE